MKKFIVSEDTEVVLNGKKYLLEAGDKIGVYGHKVHSIPNKEDWRRQYLKDLRDSYYKMVEPFLDKIMSTDKEGIGINAIDIGYEDWHKVKQEDRKEKVNNYVSMILKNIHLGAGELAKRIVDFFPEKYDGQARDWEGRPKVDFEIRRITDKLER